jgi:hypothetical protein
MLPVILTWAQTAPAAPAVRSKVSKDFWIMRSLKGVRAERRGHFPQRHHVGAG